MGNGSEGAGKYGINGAGWGSNVKGGGAVGALVRQRELGGEWVNAQVPGGVPPLGGVTDHRDEGKTRGRRRLVVPLGSGGNGNRRDPPHWGVH